MRTIYKYPIPVESIIERDGSFFISTHKGAKVIHVDVEFDGEPCIWMEIDNAEMVKKRPFWLVPTGRAIPVTPLGKLEHLATFLKKGLVFHIYEPKQQIF